MDDVECKMYYVKMKRTIYFTAALMLTTSLLAQNPIICDRYTPDPAPYVHGDTLYLFVDHDDDVTENGYFTMRDWLLYCTVDMVNWTYLGTPITPKLFSWAKQDNDCWAAQCIERNGRWYWYCTATIKGQSYPGVGVAYASNPAGPYKGQSKPLVQGWFVIDPTVFIDDDGQAYLFWGNNNLWYSKLSRNMLALQGSTTKVNITDEKAFGPYKGYNDDGSPKPNYEEAPWIYKLNGKYYLEYAAGGVPEHWAYSTADKVSGPWTYQGKVMGEAKNSFTIHGGSVDFKGHSYMFYHNGALPGGGGFKRSTCVEEFTRNEDGSIPFIQFTTKGVNPIKAVNPYEQQQAETINQSSGIKCEGDYNGCYVTNIHSSDYIKVRNVDFGETGTEFFTARIASAGRGSLLVRTGSKTGTIVARVQIQSTGGLDVWDEFSVETTRTLKGVQDLYFTFVGSTSGATLFNFDSWQFGEIGSRINEVNGEGFAVNGYYTLTGQKLQNIDEAPKNSIIITPRGKVFKK